MTPNAKELKKIAAACRKAGISHFKCDVFEFTLDTNAPTAAPKGFSKPNHGEQGEVQSDELTPEQILFWSAPPSDEELSGGGS